MASQTITGPDLQYTQDNKHCYVYSGAKQVQIGVFLTFLDFTTGSEMVVAEVHYGGDAASSADFYSKIKLNSQLIWNSAYQSSVGGTGEQPIKLIIPPFTHFEGLLTSDAGETMVMILTGRVYGHLPVRN